jgi:hypothetical protein
VHRRRQEASLIAAPACWATSQEPDRRDTEVAATLDGVHRPDDERAAATSQDDNSVIVVDSIGQQYLRLLSDQPTLACATSERTGAGL